MFLKEQLVCCDSDSVVWSMEMGRDVEALNGVWEIWEVNSGPLYNWRKAEIPKRGMISQRTLENVWALLVVVATPLRTLQRCHKDHGESNMQYKIFLKSRGQSSSQP